MRQYSVAATAEPVILAALYTDGIVTDRTIADVAYGLRAGGFVVASLVQRNEFVAGRRRCTMQTEELASGTVLTISEDRGPLARGCRLDRAALSKAESLLIYALAIRPDIVIINKFGKSEAEGSGLREPISCAAQLGVPTVVGVPYRNLDQWRAFAGELAEEVIAEPAPILSWLERRGLLCTLASFHAHATRASPQPRPASAEMPLTIAVPTIPTITPAKPHSSSSLSPPVFYLSISLRPGPSKSKIVTPFYAMRQ